MVHALGGASVGLPNPAAIIPYIGLFTLVTLDPTTAARYAMATPYLLGLSTRNNKFKEAPANTSATAKNVARIFDSLDIEKDIPFNPGIEHLHLVSQRNVTGGFQFLQGLSLLC